MFRRDFLLVASAAVIGSLVTYLTGATSATPHEVLPCESIAASGNPATAASAGVHAAPPVSTAMQQPAAAASAPQQPARRDGGNLSDDGKARNLVLVGQKQQKFGDQLSSFLSSASSSDPATINATLESRFYSEALNQEWAGSRESHIRTLFEANESLRGTTPLQVACRSKNCQVVLSASSADQARALSETFMQAATSGDVGMQDQAVSFFPDISAGRVVFYLSENGNADLFR